MFHWRIDAGSSDSAGKTVQKMNGSYDEKERRKDS